MGTKVKTKKPTSQAAKEYDALQKAVNSEREALIKTLPLKVRRNFQAIEKIVVSLEKRNLPFFLLANPAGYEFDEDPKSPTGRAFWRYQKFHGDNLPHSPEGMKLHSTCHQFLVSQLLGYISVVMPDCGVAVTDKDGKPLWVVKPKQK